MRATLRERFGYRFERFLAKGGVNIFALLIVLFIVCLLAAMLVRSLLLWVAPEFPLFESYSDHVWVTFLEMTDPGNMARDTESPAVVKLATILSGFLGVVIFSMLIAFITAVLEDTLSEFRKGRGRVLERDYTLILGWNERVVGILRELILANESECDASVVVLAEASKEMMDDELVKALPDTKTTRIITSHGNPVSLTELRRVGAENARSVIVLANCGETASHEDKDASDTRAIKVLMALAAAQGGENRLPIVAEIFQQDKRDLVEIFHDDQIITLDSWDIMGKLFVQTSLTSGLEMVYNEILSFDGAEVYFYAADWRGIQFGDLAGHFADGIPLGVSNTQGGLELRPPSDRVLEAGERIVILADDDSTINFSPTRRFSPSDLPYEARRLGDSKRRVLVLGWHEIGDIIVRESSDYLAAGSEFDVICEEPSADLQNRIRSLAEAHPELGIRLRNRNPMSFDDLKKANPFSYDNIVILSQSQTAISPERVDSDTLMILLLLRKIADETNVDRGKTKIITQILNSENQDLIVQTDVDDFIISNKLITMILAQLSEQPEIKAFYDDIFEEEGSEIYVKPASLYFKKLPASARFIDVIAQAMKRDEICLGIRRGRSSKDATRNFGVELNLAKDAPLELTADDYLVVLAEDER